ncbi:hypothetical protein [Desulfosarcina sp.]|uniref:hypothetical protein n=1 Tax=Desulfosarcina sp. TaxID=2027861 RepID=UPI00397114B5
MDGRQKPNPQPENGNDLDDDEIIDLTQILEGQDDDIIELKDILEQPDQVSNQADASDEPEISLVKNLLPEEAPDVPEDTDDEIIDLMNVAIIPQSETAEPGWQGGAIPEQPAEEEPIIDLLDAVEPKPKGAAAVGDADEEFTDLESRAQAILNDASVSSEYETPEEAAETAGPDDERLVFEAERITAPATIPTARTVRPEPSAEEPPSAGESTDASMDAPFPSPATKAEAETPPLTEQQIEDALERVIKKIYGEKIEHLLIQTIDKTIRREIEKIKNALQEDGDGMIE